MNLFLLLLTHAHLPCMLPGMRRSQGLEIMARQQGYALLAKEGENKYSLSLSISLPSPSQERVFPLSKFVELS